MFDQALLDSGPGRQPVLSRVHWWISSAAGACAFLAAQAALRNFSVLPGASRTIALSTGVGALAFANSLMLCFVFADSRRLRLNPWIWTVVLLASNLAGFFAYLVYSASKAGDWKRAALPAAYALEALLVGALVLVPLVYPDALPRVAGAISVTPGLPPARGSRATPGEARRVRHQVADLRTAHLIAPKNLPDVIESPAPPEGPTTGVVGNLPPGSPSGVPYSIFTGLTAWPPPPAPPTRSAKVPRIKVGGIVEAARLIFAPRPEYPPLAKIARIQGMVRLEAIISKDGTVQELKVLGGHPLLAKAAIEAVSLWRYQPTLLNGEPVEVVTEIEVNFILSD